LPHCDNFFTLGLQTVVRKKIRRLLAKAGGDQAYMLRKSLIILSIVFCAHLSQAETFGLGAVIGDPTGVSVKIWLDQTHAIDGAFAWSLSGPNAIHVQSDYLTHNFSFFHVGKNPLNLYYGAGGRLTSYSSKNKSGLGLGARAPLGVAYQFYRPSVELFAELAAVLELIPSTDVYINLGFGGRFYF
jgi:hypothetical protein